MNKKSSKFINTLTNITLNWFRYAERLINHRLLPDKLFLSLLYRTKFGKKLDWENPKTFNEKLQWIKLYDRRPEYTIYADKNRVREYIAKTIGEKYLIPLVGVWNSPDEIDFNKLPNQFVLKCNHDSGSLCICKNKENFNINKVKEKLKKCFKFDFYIKNREWPYKNIKKKIIAEKYIIDETESELKDYKVVCFNGKAKYIKVCFNRNYSTGFKNTNWYDLNWNLCDFGIHPADKNVIHTKPNCLNEMIDLSEKIAKNIPFCRVDWYIIDGKLYFGEITLFPSAGFGQFEPKIYSYKFGDLLKLPIVTSAVKNRKILDSHTSFEAV